MLTTGAAVLIGMILWTLAEYVIHRWLGHHRRWVRVTPFGREHTLHHGRGNYFAPTRYKIAVAILIVPLIAGALMTLVSPTSALGVASGFAVAYVAYEWLHRRMHTHPPHTGYGRWARRHHFFHHFHDPTRNHGVTSPIWDVCFGTHARPHTIVVPRKLCMRWLVEPTSAARAAWHGDYAIRG